MTRAHLSPVDQDLWVVHVPLRVFGLLELGTRMTVMRLKDGSIVVHSPVLMDAALRAEITALGPVRFVVAPNLFHHMFAGDALAAWPDARLLAPAKLRARRKDLRIDAALENGAPPEWKGQLDLLPIDGSILRETVLYHRATKTLVSSDLLENFHATDHTLTRAYLKLGGIYGRPGWHPIGRVVYLNRRAAKKSIERILDQELSRVVIAHGEVITERPKEAIQQGLAFLLK